MQARAAIAGIDPSAALELPGVEAFIAAKDLPKHRNLISYGVLAKADEPIFAGERVEYYGQPLGLVLATSQASLGYLQTYHILAEGGVLWPAPGPGGGNLTGKSGFPSAVINLCLLCVGFS